MAFAKVIGPICDNAYQHPRSLCLPVWSFLIAVFLNYNLAEYLFLEQYTATTGEE